jgi:hypothetical protein
MLRWGHRRLAPHIVDLSNYLVGPIESVAGTSRIFVNERNGPRRQAKIEIEDASIFVCQYAKARSATSRPRARQQNANTFEVNDEHGSVLRSGGHVASVVFRFRELSMPGWKKMAGRSVLLKQWRVPGCAVVTSTRLQSAGPD